VKLKILKKKPMQVGIDGLACVAQKEAV